MTKRQAAVISVKELANKIMKEVQPSIDGVLRGYDLDNHPLIGKDLSKVQFDFENFTYTEQTWLPELKGLLGYQTLSNGISFLGCHAGGDWEVPIFFIIYFDGKNLRGYIPSEGNSYNKKTKAAFGNDDAADVDEIEDGVEFDGQKLLSDIQSRLTVDSQPAQKPIGRLKIIVDIMEKDERTIEDISYHAQGILLSGLNSKKMRSIVKVSVE